MAITEDYVLLTASELYEIWAIALDDLSMRVFGDETFQALMSEMRQSWQNSLNFYMNGLIILIISITALILICIWEGMQQVERLLRLAPNFSGHDE